MSAQARARKMQYIRDKMLRESEWTQLPDANLTPEKKAEWDAYRQSLTDLVIEESSPIINFPRRPQ